MSRRTWGVLGLIALATAAVIAFAGEAGLRKDKQATDGDVGRARLESELALVELIGAERTSEEEVEEMARKAIAAFDGVRDLEELGSLVAEWGKLPPQIRKRIVIMLLERTGSTKLRKVPSPTLQGHPRLIEMEEGAMCAHAIGGLLNRRLPFVNALESEEENARVVLAIHRKVVETMHLPLEIDLTQLTLDQCRRLASARGTAPPVLARLAASTDTETRQRVAAHARTPFVTLRKMSEEDADAEVRSAARKNMGRPRTYPASDER